MRKFIGAAVVAGFAVTGLLVTSASGGPAPTSPQTFTDPALNPQSFTVPPDVCEVTITAEGGRGGQFVGGGEGGSATATIPVTPGETLTVNVGGVGGTPVNNTGGVGGINGGGDGGSGTISGGGIGGGGSSDVSQAGARVVVAGGGGGGSGAITGGNGGGATASNGGGTDFGGGATAAAVGAAGGNGTAGTAGTGGTGGTATVTGVGGGGGGGGFFGGGGGGGEQGSAVVGGGGGGSGFTPDGTGLTTGGGDGLDGDVELTWTVDPGCADAEPAAAVPVAAEPTFTG